ncbi:Cyclic nucleotide-gated cation channel alpha-3 [Pseudolycoriella hygida]|uniref:Cyclic nucleotide-gated cation channel alpha-3 n=1 Tax=Pseudolycoriella hygida TaxID=35572 RepID=A0A9Q0MRE8_9DIPT|nr:Cyclic nucleotide-gated cation channel alpha-3 [Pseudolycoriella hygida]
MLYEMDQTAETNQPKRNPVVRAVAWHFGNTKCSIDQQQYEKEKYLFGKVKFNPWILMPAAVIVQFCCGSVYAWSVFNEPIDEAITGNSKASQAPLTFYINIGVLGFAAAFMGPWIERNGPKKALIVASSFFYLGNLISALAIHVKLMWLLYIGYGLVAGFGVGISYVTPVAALQKWFPHRRGLAAGFGVCGFGGGSIVIGKVILPLIDAVGLPLTFVVLGSSYFFSMICTAFLFRVPPPGYSVHHEDEIDNEKKEQQPAPLPEINFTAAESIKSFDYFLLYVMLFANILFGLVVISRLSNMITQVFLKKPDEAATMVSVNGALNLFGRIFFSTLSDKIGRKPCFIIMLIAQTIILLTFPLYMEGKIYWAFLLCMFSLTMCYGGGFGVIGAFLADMFGSKNVGVCFGLILTSWSIGGVGGGLTFTAIYNAQISNGFTTEDAYPYIVNTYWVLAFVVTGLLSAIIVRTTIKDRTLPAVKGEWFRFRIFSKVVRIKRITSCPEIEILNKQEFEKEWDVFVQSRHITNQQNTVETNVDTMDPNVAHLTTANAQLTCPTQQVSGAVVSPVALTPGDTRISSMVTSVEDDEDSSNAASSDCKSPGQRTKSNQRWMKLRTTVQLSSAIQKKPPLKREDSFLKRFSTRQISETQEAMEETGSESASGDHDKTVKRRRYNRKRLSVVNPDENFYFYWLMMLTSCILYNLWTLIVRQSFPELQALIPEFWKYCDYSTDAIFVLDVIVQIRTGYLEQGLMVYNDKKLAKHYMRSRKFIFDIVALTPLQFIQGYIGNQPLIRFPRFLKVYRSVKFYYIVESRTVWPNLWRVVNLIHILLILAHWFGCFYYLLSEAEGFQGDWVYPYRPGDYATLTRKYLGSLYWSTLTLTTIGDLPTPETNAE